MFGALMKFHGKLTIVLTIKVTYPGRARNKCLNKKKPRNILLRKKKNKKKKKLASLRIKRI